MAATLKKVALYQNDPRFGEVARNLEAAQAALAGVRADLLILPELFATGYQFDSAAEVRDLSEPVPGGPTTAALEALARSTGATVIAGLAERAPDGRIFNSAAIVYPSGFLVTYRKVHLFHEERIWFAPGDRLPPVIRTPQGLRVGVMICFDWRFPEVARHLALEGADVIAHPSNLVRPHCPDAMITRALENKVFTATANRVGEEARGGRPALRYIGRSQVVSPSGERLAALGTVEPGVIEVEVDPALARSKRVTGCEDLFAARRTDLLEVVPRLGGASGRAPSAIPPSPVPAAAPSTPAARQVTAPGGARRYALHRHDVPGGAAHFDLLLERDGVLLAWRLAAPPWEGARGPARAQPAERTFDHRPRYLEFAGDLGQGRGVLAPVEQGTYRAHAEGPAALEVALGQHPPLRLTLDDVVADRWRIEPA